MKARIEELVVQEIAKVLDPDPFERDRDASRAALLSPNVAGLVKELRQELEEGFWRFEGNNDPDSTCFSYCRYCNAVEYKGHKSDCRSKDKIRALESLAAHMEKQLAERDAALRERLEVADHGYDGIACRDETIRLYGWLREIHQAMKRGTDTADHGPSGNYRCIIDAVCAYHENAAERDAYNAALAAQVAERDAEIARIKAHAEAAVPIVKHFCSRNPCWTNGNGPTHDPLGAHAWLAAYRIDYPKES